MLNRLNVLKASRGSAFILVLLSLTVVFSLGVSLMSVTVTNYHMDRTEHDYQTAYYVAEGALRYHVEQMRLIMEELCVSGNYDDALSFFDAFMARVSSISTPDLNDNFNKQAHIDVDVTDTRVEDGKKIFTVHVTCTVGSLSRSLKSMVEISWDALDSMHNSTYKTIVFGGAIFTSETMKFYNNVVVNGNIVTNTIKEDGVELENNVVINGNIYIGFGGEPDEVVQRKNNAVVNGQIKVNSINIELPAVAFPSGLPDRGDLRIDNNETKSISGGSRYNTIEIKNKGILTVRLDGDTVIRANSLYFGNDAILRLSGSGRLSIYIDDTIHIDNNSLINSDGQANDLLLISAGSKITLDNNSVYKGSLYAPNADVQMENNAVVHGNVVAKSIVMYQNSQVFFSNVIKNGYPMPIPVYAGSGEDVFNVIYVGES